MQRAIGVARAHREEGGKFAIAAVIFDEHGHVISEGYRHKPYKDVDESQHAERHAIKNAERMGKTDWGSYTLVVTVEPCFSCARWIINRGFKKVVIGTLDTNRLDIFMQQVRRLKTHGIDVVLAKREDQDICAELLGREHDPKPEYIENLPLSVPEEEKKVVTQILLRAISDYKKTGQVPDGLKEVVTRGMRPSRKLLLPRIESFRNAREYSRFEHLVRILGWYLDSNKEYYAIDADNIGSLEERVKIQGLKVDHSGIAVVILFGNERNKASARRLLQQWFTEEQLLDNFPGTEEDGSRIRVDGLRGINEYEKRIQAAA